MAYSPNGVVFDGTDSARKTTAYTGAADSGLLTFALAVRFTGTAADQHIISGGTTATRYVIGRRATNALYCFCRNAAGTSVLSFDTSALSNDTWYAILCSFDLSSASLRHLYVNDSADLTVNTYVTGESIDFTVDNNTVGAVWDESGFKVNGEIADLWFDFGRYVDFSVAANRRKFFRSDNSLADKGSDGSRPFAVAPIGFFQGTTASWHTNKGSGGGLTLTGTLGTSSSQPAGSDTTLADKAPDAILASTNLNGAVTDIDDDPQSPGADWLTVTSATSSIALRVSFPSPGGTIEGTQLFRLWLRKTSGATNPIVDVELWENGSFVKKLLDNVAITSTSGQLLTAVWDAGDLAAANDGSLVECRVAGGG